MTIDIVVPGPGSGVADTPQPAFSLEGPQGPRGPTATVGIEFRWPGPILAGEAAQFAAAPTSGTFDPASCGGGCDPANTASATSVFTLTKNGVSVGTATFAAATVEPVIAFTDATRSAGDMIGCKPPATPDATLQGATFFLAP